MGPRGLQILILASVCIAFATHAVAEAQPTWVGARLQFPVPALDVGDTELGVDAGVTFTRMKNKYVGVGADLVHHYWPASSGYVAALDRYLRSNRFQTLEGSEWALAALQVTAHVRFVVPAGQRYLPWVQVGAGAYRLNRNLEEQRPEGTYAWVTGPGLGGAATRPGMYGGIGFDVRLSPPVWMGLEATYHHVWSLEWGLSGADLPDFSAFTVGARFMLGWGESS